MAQEADPAPARSGIVVHGEQARTSAWRRAETDHVVVLSDGGEEELRRTAADLERQYLLMARLYNVDPARDETARLQVTLFASRSFFRDLALANLRSGEGPYAAGLTDQRYYDPREDGPVLALARVDQLMEMNTTRARDSDCRDQAIEGNDCIGNSAPDHPPSPRPWRALLFSAFAQHFILSHLPSPYPRWYLDGVGTLFSTLKMRDDGAVDYARLPDGYKDVLRSYGPVDLGDVLSGRYLEPGYGRTQWTPYHAGLIAHFFLYSDLKPERRSQFSRYMAAIAQGQPMAQAAAVFGDPRRLQHDFAVYMEKPITYARTDRHKAVLPDPLVTNLTAAQAAMVPVRLQPDSPPARAWLRQVHEAASRNAGSPDALLLAARVECGSGQGSACLADADHALAIAHDNAADQAEALGWKGMAQTEMAIAGPAPDRAAALATARETIEHAIRLDGQAPLPLIAWFESFAKAGEPVPLPAMAGVAKVARFAPAAPGPRLLLASELLRQGNGALARRVLLPVLYGAYETPEKAQAQAMLATATQ